MFIKSIRWRLQIWLAFLLICTLSGFALATYEAHRIKQYQQVDDELGRRVEGLALMVRGRFSPGGRPPFNERNRPEPFESKGRRPPGRPEDFPRPEPPGKGPAREILPPFPDDHRQFGTAAGDNSNSPAGSLPGASEFRLPPNFERFRQQDEELGIYFTIWNRDGTRMDGSTNAPADLTRPTQEHSPDSGPHFRTRGVYREGFDFNREGRCVLVGRSIATELTAMRSFAFILAGAGAAVLALGLGGGWWIATRAIRPVEAISAAASRISAGHLSERINVEDTDGELGRLAGVLNSTFARLDAAFAQQRQFTADASHELRTPLAVLISEAQTALAHQRTAGEYRETLEACLDTAQQMRRLTEALLQLARFDAGQNPLQRARLDLAENVRACVELIHPLADPRGIRLVCNLAPAEARGDAELLERVITNLLTNAIHYNKPKGEVRISTSVENGAAVLTVADTGQGIAPEDLPHIFERFFRADKSRSRAHGRAGLGLAICKAIVDAHGGSIEVTSRPDNGAVFTVRFPAGVVA